VRADVRLFIHVRATVQFLLSQKPRVLLVRYDQALTSEKIADLDRALAEFVSREGTMDTIFDFSSAPPSGVETSVMVEYGRAPTRMPGRRRLFVVPNELYFGMFRLYGAYQEARGEETPKVVNSLEEALALLGAQSAVFAPC